MSAKISKRTHDLIISLVTPGTNLPFGKLRVRKNIELAKKSIPAPKPSGIMGLSPDQMLYLLANKSIGFASLNLLANNAKGIALPESIKNSVWPPKLNEIRESRAVGR